MGVGGYQTTGYRDGVGGTNDRVQGWVGVGVPHGGVCVCVCVCVCVWCVCVCVCVCVLSDTAPLSPG